MKLLLLILSFQLLGCSSFKAQRIGAVDADERGLDITDNWMSQDTKTAVKEILKQMKKHRGYKKYMARFRGEPKLFIGEIQNNTSEAYFPIGDFNDEFLYKISQKGDFILVDAAAREKILSEITYQNDGMVDPATAKQIGKQVGADLMVFGSIYMKPEKRKGKKIKEYSVNLRLTDIQKGTEVLRTRTKVFKYSDQKSLGW